MKEKRVRGPEPSQLLLDFRHVQKKEKKEDRSPGQKAARSLLEKDPGEFLGQLQELEKAQRQSDLEFRATYFRHRAQKQEEAVVEDVGVEKALQLAEAVLIELERGVGPPGS